MQASPTAPSISDSEIDALVRYWNAANYLTVAQIYLCRNPLLARAARPEHIKPRLLGHWGTSPGSEPRLRAAEPADSPTDATSIYVTGPGHGGPALVANVYLEGTYSEVYPEVSAR